MAITTLDGLIAGQKPPVNFWQLSSTTEGASTWFSFWRLQGFPGFASANPPAFNSGSGYACTNSTNGALPFTNPGGGGNSHLSRFCASSNTTGTLVLYDRIWHCSGFDTTSVATQSITTPGTMAARDVTGSTNGEGLEIWGEVYGAPGATGATWTVSYTDQAGNSSQSATYAHPANAETVGQMFPFIMASGDYGVRAVSSFTCSISSGTAGNVGITVLRRIAEISFDINYASAIYDGISLGLPRIYDSSCLALMMYCSSTVSGQIIGSFSYSQG